MGIKSPTGLVYTIKGLTVKTIKDITKNIHFEHDTSPLSSSSSTENNDSNNPINILHEQSYLIDIDCNWVACQLGAIKSPSEAATITADFLETLAHYGFDVTPICDGDKQHHTKRATVSEQNSENYST